MNEILTNIITSFSFSIYFFSLIVPWCGHCCSTLAKAEMEYKTKTDTSCFCLFPFSQKSSVVFKSMLKEKGKTNMNSTKHAQNKTNKTNMTKHA